MKTKPTTKFGRAKQRLKSVKAFYSHLIVFVLIACITLLIRSAVLAFFIGKTSDPNFVTWIDLNIFINLAIWGAIVIIHAFWIFGHTIPFFKNWEEQKIKEYMEEEDKKIQRL